MIRTNAQATISLTALLFAMTAIYYGSREPRMGQADRLRGGASTSQFATAAVGGRPYRSSDLGQGGNHDHAISPILIHRSCVAAGVNMTSSELTSPTPAALGRDSKKEGELQSRAPDVINEHASGGNPKSAALVGGDEPRQHSGRGDTDDPERTPVTANTKGQPRADEASRALTHPAPTEVHQQPALLPSITNNSNLDDSSPAVRGDSSPGEAGERVSSAHALDRVGVDHGGARRWIAIPPFMPIIGHAPADTSFIPTDASTNVAAPLRSVSTTFAGTAAPDSTITDRKYLGCNAWVFQAANGYPIAGTDGRGGAWPISNAAWLAAAEKAFLWSEDICRRFTPRDCLAYGAYLNSCAGGDIVRQWYGDGTQADPDVPRWLCEQGYASPLYPKFYPVHGICPVRGPQPEGAVKPQLEAVMISYNGRAPQYWPVSWKDCEPGQECVFQYFFPCEPLWDPPHIVEWIWKMEPGRIRPSGGAE